MKWWHIPSYHITLQSYKRKLTFQNSLLLAKTTSSRKVDVNREDVLREATEKMGAHLNAGERGILAVVNTAGSVFRGRIDTQESQEWENMFKTNVLGCLRVARAFIGLLRPTRWGFDTDLFVVLPPERCEFNLNWISIIYRAAMCCFSSTEVDSSSWALELMAMVCWPTMRHATR